MSVLPMLIVAGSVLFFGLFSARAQRSLLTPPMVFTALGLVFGAHGLGLVELDVDHEVIHALAEIALAVILFGDAARIDLGRLRREHDLPQRMLLIGLPLAVIFGTLLAIPLFPGLPLFEAALLAAILAPTDAALGQPVVSSKDVPVRIRQTINVESGLNDGLALPAVLILISLACATTEAGAAVGGVGYWVAFTAGQVILGPLVGIAFGYLGGKLFNLAREREWTTGTFRDLSAVALAVTAFAAAEMVHGNGFLSAFIAGITFGAVACDAEMLDEFIEAEGQLLTLFVFAIFGGVLLPEALESFHWTMLVYAIGSLTVVRMAAIGISLAGKKLGRDTVLFLGWFGPRGIASILFALVMVRASQLGEHEHILPIIMVTVLLSIVLHGMSAGPLAKAYGRRQAVRDRAAPEHQEVSEHP